ncbi:MAG: ATP-dependent sacrificial sulfur transferase LarE [Desulfobacterales bacterium]|nr:ATP-dependent sacrificial sulfur transferase LarE [Desulfobacterales bacterium]
MNQLSLNNKKKQLVLILKKLDSLMVAFSGGVDSTFLLAVAHEVLKKNVVAVTAVSQIHPARENKEATVFVKNYGIKHIMLQSKEMSLPAFVVNKKDRCYVCKKNLFEKLIKIASNIGIKYIAHGANTDDLEDFRPGHVAAQQMGVLAPMIDAGLTKDAIRLLSKKMNLEAWNKPALACLATRIPYDTPITVDALKMVDKAEDVLVSLGFNACRVRKHENTARIEVNPEKIGKISDKKNRETIIREFRKIGFSSVTIDLEGYVPIKPWLNLAHK